ncbi:ATP-dependent DNA helicase RecG [Acididesulfobacillus acetoxydans]|uniref:ATP-dependent DNA helicase RecG n=1 Tax=Acididesulfobacillus acetoxydans TaxID=1561005 RepID=UPI003FD8555B
MAMNTLRLVLANLRKAAVAEERQGYTNTGALGGFSVFLNGILPRLEQLVPGRNLTLMRQIALRYAHMSPLKRREAFPALLAEIDGLTEEAGEQRPAGEERSVSGEERLTAEKRSVSGEEQPAAAGGPGVCGRPSALSPGGHGKGAGISGFPEKVKDSSLQFLKGVGPERMKQLQGLGLETARDLLLYFPRRYEDRRLRSFEELRDGETASVYGTVVYGQVSPGRIKVIKLGIEQGRHVIQAVWFNRTYVLRQYPVGTRVVVTGKIQCQRHLCEILAADIESADGEGSARDEIVPVYSETARLSSKTLRGIVRQVVDRTEGLFPEFLGAGAGEKWMERAQAYREIHFPRSAESLALARTRLVWEEVLFLQLAVALLRRGPADAASPALNRDTGMVAGLLAGLPFGLTKAQERVIGEILRDMAGTKGMARLVQGDVGSGKTVVAMAALLRAVESGYQGAMMAPTEILAEQHYQSLEKSLTPLGVKIALLLGSQSRSLRDETLRRLALGQVQVVVGTHALIQESVSFRRLGLAVTDEQHRFGVRQRSLLRGKGESPHVLVLTATPIPRTLALTLYGDLQLSVIDEMPAGRKPVLTRRLSERGRPSLEKFMEEQMSRGRQIYVVCPLVQGSEMSDLVSAEERAEALQRRFPQQRIALLHGRMKGGEKEAVMHEFQRGGIHILVATTVVEVGVNVPNASVMVIEGAERFGLAQLHQLRGRVGRGSEQSYCILMSEAKSSRRLEVLCRTQDGFKIAEEDLRLRGPGELMGTRQHGLPELRLTDLSRDGLLVEQAHLFAQKVLAEPDRYQAVLEAVSGLYDSGKTGIH